MDSKIENKLENKEYHAYESCIDVSDLKDIDLNGVVISEVEIDSELRVAVHRT